MALSFCFDDSPNRAIKHLVIQAWSIIYYFLYYSTSLPSTILDVKILENLTLLPKVWVFQV